MWLLRGKKASQTSPHSPCHFEREKRTSGSRSPVDCPHTGQPQTVASFLQSPINSSPGRLAARSRLAFLATSSFPFPILRSFVCEGPNAAETIYRLLSCTSCRGQECWPNNWRTFPGRDLKPRLKKHLPICQEHGKSCCLFYAGRGPKAQHHSIWLTNHRNFKTQRSDSTVFL